MMNVNLPTLKIEPLTSVEVKLDKIAAVYYKISVERKASPQQIFFDALGGDCDLQVFYSYSNQYPCEAPDNDGFFKNSKEMSINSF